MTSAERRSISGWLDASARIAEKGDALPALREARLQSVTALSEQGLPTRRQESWKYTSLAEMAKVEWSAPADPGEGILSLPSTPLSRQASLKAGLVDGQFVSDAESSDGAGARFESMAKMRTSESAHPNDPQVLGQVADPKLHFFTALNTALVRDGVCLEIDRDAQITSPLHLSITDSKSQALSCPRLAVRARAGSRSTLVIEHLTPGDGPRLSAFVSEVIVEPQAELDLVLVQRGGAESFLASNLYAQQEQHGQLRIHTLTLGGRLVRNEVVSVLSGQGAAVDLRGLFIGSDERHIDHQTTIDHAVSHCTSRELYKGVLGDSSRGVFCGRIIVRPDAQKTDSQQSNPNLLLGEKAEINTQPQLEIYADDVRCSHGSTIGRLDPEALFYLRSRAIGPEAARAMLTRGFAQEIVDSIPQHVDRTEIEALIVEALAAATSRDSS